MPQRDASLKVDFTKIAFPSDRVTLRQLRLDQPGLFHSPGLRGERIGEINISATMRGEQILAAKAFAGAAMQADPYPRVNGSEQVALLNEDYLQYGLSTGIQQTRHLVRKFETAAAIQVTPRSAGR